MEQSPRSATGSPTNQRLPMTTLFATGSGQRRSGIGPSCGTGSRNTTPMFSHRNGSIAARRAVGLSRYKKSKAFCTLLPGYKLFSVEVVLGTVRAREV